MQPDGSNRVACEQTTAKFGTQVNWIFQENYCSHVNWILTPIWGFGTEFIANFQALELKISRKLCLGWKKGLSNCKMLKWWPCKWPGEREKGSSGPHIPVPYISVSAPPPPIYSLQDYKFGFFLFLFFCFLWVVLPWCYNTGILFRKYYVQVPYAVMDMDLICLNYVLQWLLNRCCLKPTTPEGCGQDYKLAETSTCILPVNQCWNTIDRTCTYTKELSLHAHTIARLH